MRMGNSVYIEAEKWLKDNDNFLVVSHVNPDGDATGSLLAIAEILRLTGKKGTFVNEGRTPSRFSYLPGYEHIINFQEDPLKLRFSHVIMVDCADRTRAGIVERCFDDGAEILNIDHHPTNDHYGSIAMVNPNASSTCEVIFDWVRSMGLPVSGTLAKCLYTGYLTDTGGFRYSNTTPKVLRDASELVELGAPPYEIAERALESITYEHILLLSKALASLELTNDGKVAYISLPLSLLQETGASKEDAEGLVNYGRNIEGVEVGVLLRETEDGVKVSLRSKDYVDVSQIAKQLGGGGHIRASGCFVEKGLSEIRNLLQSLIEKHLKEDKQHD
jgi:phosphoesterase RecJ-like protein